jgi:hypothetical protein
MAGITELVHPLTGEKLVLSAHRREEIHHGAYVERAPDIALKLAPGIKITPAPGDGHLLDDVEAQGRGLHRPEGVLVAAGPAIQPGRVADANLADLAPTIMALMGLPVPNEMSGRILTELFAEPLPQTEPISQEADAAQWHVDEGGYTEKEAAQIADHLRSLGYLE